MTVFKHKKAKEDYDKKHKIIWDELIKLMNDKKLSFNHEGAILQKMGNASLKELKDILNQLKRV